MGQYTKDEYWRYLGLTAAAHKVLFGGYMGCGWKRWADAVNLERMKMMLQGWQEVRQL
jgi:hypothetical protein